MKETSFKHPYEKPSIDIIYMEPEGIIAASGESSSSGKDFDNGDDIQLDSWF